MAYGHQGSEPVGHEGRYQKLGGLASTLEVHHLVPIVYGPYSALLGVIEEPNGRVVCFCAVVGGLLLPYFPCSACGVYTFYENVSDAVRLGNDEPPAFAFFDHRLQHDVQRREAKLER